MRNLLLLVVVVTISSRKSFAVPLFESCSSTNDCTLPNAECRILSPSCGRGTCVCIPGFMEHLNGTEYSCKRNVRLGGACKAGVDTCSSANADCIEGRCACLPGYNSGPGGAAHTCTIGTQGVAGKCNEDSECYSFGNLRCKDNQCECKPGYRSFDKYRCARRNVGDACNIDNDCAAMPYTVCRGGVCACADGAQKRLVTLPAPISNFEPLYDNVIQGYACFTNSMPSGEGQACFSGDDYLVVPDLVPVTVQTTPAPEGNPVYVEGGGEAAAAPEVFMEENYNAGGEEPAPTTPEPAPTEAVRVPPLTLCAAPFQCTYCTLDRPICARMMPVYASANGFTSNAITIVAAATIFAAFV